MMFCEKTVKSAEPVHGPGNVRGHVDALHGRDHAKLGEPRQIARVDVLGMLDAEVVIPLSRPFSTAASSARAACSGSGGGMRRATSSTSWS